MSDLVTIASETLTARINPRGAELWSLTDAAGREYMTDADPAFWTGHAPILFPIIGMLNDGRYRLDGVTHELAKHGFARHATFECIGADATSTLFMLRADPHTHAIFPFNFNLAIHFRVVGAKLFIGATVQNFGDVPIPFSFGFHPAFAWPLPGGAAKADHCVTFAEPEPQPIRRIDPASGLLLAQRFDTPVDGRELRLDASLFEADALIWDDVASRAVTFGAKGSSALTVAFPDMSMLGIWQKPGAAYLCIEPWQGIADPVGYQGDFRDKPGVVSLPPGKARSFRMDVTVTPPPEPA